MAATLKLNYKQVYNLAMQLSIDQQEKLARALTSSFEEAREASRPYTVEEVRGFMREAEADIEAGRYCTAEEGMRRMDEKFPWLCN